ncbi:hypothetical protein TWF281_006070 [Arthrobotrys megalospora]
MMMVVVVSTQAKLRDMGRDIGISVQSMHASKSERVATYGRYFQRVNMSAIELFPGDDDDVSSSFQKFQ